MHAVNTKPLPNPSARPAARRWLAFVLVAGGCMLGGCSVFRSEAGGTLTASSADGARSLAPSDGFATAAYTSIDENTADVYLSDLPVERFQSGKDMLADATGTIFHLHIFLVPSAGNTPIDQTACNITIRQLVLTGTPRAEGRREIPTMGLYGGGGFVLPSGTFGEGTIGGSISAASFRMTRSTPGFKDLLGSGSLSGRFSAPQDDDLAKAMSSKFEYLVNRMAPPAMPTDKEQLPVLRVKDKAGAESKPDPKTGTKAAPKPPAAPGEPAPASKP